MRRITAILAVMCGCIFFFPWPVPAADELVFAVVRACLRRDVERGDGPRPVAH